MSAAIIPGIKIGGALLGGFLGRRSAKGAVTPGPTEQAAMGGATSLAQLLGRQGQSLFQTGGQQIRQTGQFLGNLVSGNRAAIQQTLAPERAAITDLFSGAQRRIASQARGGVRDLAQAQAARQQAGQLSLLAPQVRTQAASALGNLGLGAAQTGVDATGAGAQTFASLLGPLIRGRLGGAEVQRRAGQDVGSLIFEILQGINFGRRGAAAATG